MKEYFYVLICLLFIGSGCDNKKSKQTVNSPLSVVVQLKAAEFMLDFEAAKVFIDVNSVYGGKDLGDSLSPEQAWRQLASFMVDVDNRKFTRQFKYYEYDIIERVNGTKAEVFFRPKERRNHGMTYKLENRNNAWIVYDIEFKTPVEKNDIDTEEKK